MELSQRRKKLVGRLQVPKMRAREGAVLVEGVRAVREAVASGTDIAFAVRSPALAATEGGAGVVTLLQPYDVVEVSDRELGALSATAAPQGVLLVCAEPRADLTTVRGGDRCLVLDAVQDPGNAGTLVRAAAAFAVDTVVCLDGTVDPWGPKAVRASAGTMFRIPVVRAPSVDVLSHLGSVALPLLAADASGEDVDGCRGVPSFALALGNEGGGVRGSVLAAAERRVAVTMPGELDSLNVAMAGSILLHALTRTARP